jgi:2-desacetyl-2-hydroxyethyl bacteriochlorophyllide A dehydrogenase
MRAVVAAGGKVDVESINDPIPGAGQVLVAPLACGICGSDLHFLETQRGMPDLLPPTVLGHEFVGEVIDFGPETARDLKPGTLVTSIPYLNTPAGPQLIGLSPSASGGLAERMILQESRVVAVSPHVLPEHAAFAEPLAVGLHAVNAAELKRDDVALVVGCGPVGLAVIASLKASGQGPVVATDFSPTRRRLAETLGADIVLDPANGGPYTTWTDLAGQTLPPSPLWERQLQARSVVFECVGTPGMLQTVIDAAPSHCRVIVVGVCQQPDTVTPVSAIAKELTMRFVFAYRPTEFQQALRWITDADVDVRPLITTTLDLDAAPRAFAELHPPSEHCKIMLRP